MSTSETVTLNAGDCPCGEGEVVKHVTSQDNPWSSVDIRYALECPTCAKEWRLDSRQLVLRSSEVAYQHATSHESECYKPLRIFVDAVVDDYFTRYGASSKKAEHAEMQRLDICCQSYSSFLRSKKEGKLASQIAYGLRNTDWLSSLAKKTGNENEFQNLLSAWQDSKAASETTGKQIVRRRFD